jgi:hypothetical protein
MKKLTVSFILICCAFATLAQDIPMGTWRTHQSYNNGRILTASPTKVYCAVENGLFSLDLEDRSLTKISKISGLSDAAISAIQYDDAAKLLVIGYTSGLIDLITEKGVVTIRDLKQNNLEIEKTIYDLEIHDGSVYAATSFGVIVISLRENAILDNFKSIGKNATDVSVRELLEADGLLYAKTTDGIQVGDLSENLLDFNNWTRYRLNANHTFAKLTQADGIHLIHNDTMVSKLVGDTLVKIASYNQPIKSLRYADGKLNVLLANELHQIVGGVSSKINTFTNVKNANDLIYANGLWVADSKMGLVDAEEKAFVPNGPLSDQINYLTMDENMVYAFYGPKAQDFNGSLDLLGYNTFENAVWEYTSIPNFSNLTDVATYRSKRYFSSAGQGLFSESEQKIYNESNSILEKNKDQNGVHISNLVVGKSLWMGAYDHDFPVLTLDKAGEWAKYSANEVGTGQPIDMKLANSGLLWLTRGEGNVAVWDPIEKETSVMNAVRGVPSSVVNGLAISVKDETWIATNGGLVAFSDADYVASDEVAFPLFFENEEVYKGVLVTAVATDGGGRVWVAGRDHLAVYNSLLTKREFFFTEENSPLLSNDILKMVYQPSNGEMFILTAKGLISYRSNSSEATLTHQQVNIFPNPVRPGYDGLVGITGLAADVDIKITDVNGKLMQQIQARGGSASWNLRDYNNSKVKSGIYLILSSSEDGTETHVGKIAIIQP